MSFLVPCPNCGPRDVNEFTCSGEVTARPEANPSLRELTSYLYYRRNVAGIQREWWFHRFGCRLWFYAERDTRTNAVLETELPHAPDVEGARVPSDAVVPDTPAV